MKLFSFAYTLALLGLTSAFELKISDDHRQACSGMWGGDNAYIEVTFDPASRGQVAMVTYEWRDTRYLGIDTEPDTYIVPKPTSKQRTYVCTEGAVRAKLCPESRLGRFILDLRGASLEETSIWSASVGFGNSTGSGNLMMSANSTIAISPRRVNNTVVPNGVLWYTEPILYQVDKKGYYCVATIPIATGATADTAVYAEYKGQIIFNDVFQGKLQTTDYPKLNFFMAMTLVYLALGAVWGFMCFKHRDDLLPLHFHISYLVTTLIIEMTATWGYYKYLNSHDRGTATTMFLVVLVILNAGKNALSVYLLLFMSLIVVESLDPPMTFIKRVAWAHFASGALYAMGMFVFGFSSLSGWLDLICIVPFVLTLVTSLVSIGFGLYSTIGQLEEREQTHKPNVFRTLSRILLLAAAIILAFVISGKVSLESDEAETWETRWFFLDAWLVILYFLVFTSIAFLCHPTNDSQLAMPDELAQGEDPTGEYGLELIRSGGPGEMREYSRIRVA